MKIAGQTCIYTNNIFTIEELTAATVPQAAPAR